MPNASNLRVAQITPELGSRVRRLRITADQYAYVGDIEFNLIDAERDPQSDAMAILFDETVIGFYRIDYAPTIVSRMALGAATVGLRALSLDRTYQGQKLAVPSILACCADLSQRKPERRLLALNVHCCNRPAVRAYRNAGFVDSGGYYFGGSAGPQCLMLRRLE